MGSNLVSLVKGQSLLSLCFLHRDTTYIKVIVPELASRLSESIKRVNKKIGDETLVPNLEPDFHQCKTS